MIIKKTYDKHDWVTVEVDDIVKNEDMFIIYGKILDCEDPDDIWIKGVTIPLIMSPLCEVLER